MKKVKITGNFASVIRILPTFYRLLPTFYRLFTGLDSQALHKPVTLVKKDSMVDALPEQSWATDISKQYLELGDLKITLNLSDQHFTKFSIKDFFSKCDRKSPVSDGRAYIYWRNTFFVQCSLIYLFVVF